MVEEYRGVTRSTNQTNTHIFDRGTLVEQVEGPEELPESGTSTISFSSSTAITLENHGDVSNIEDYFKGWAIQLNGNSNNNFYGLIKSATAWIDYTEWPAEYNTDYPRSSTTGLDHLLIFDWKSGFV